LAPLAETDSPAAFNFKYPRPHWARVYAEFAKYNKGRMQSKNQA